MKKLVLLLAVVASATLFSCSGNGEANASSAAETAAAAEVGAPAAPTANATASVAE